MLNANPGLSDYVFSSFGSSDRESVSSARSAAVGFPNAQQTPFPTFSKPPSLIFCRIMMLFLVFVVSTVAVFAVLIVSCCYCCPWAKMRLQVTLVLDKVPEKQLIL